MPPGRLPCPIVHSPILYCNVCMPQPFTNLPHLSKNSHFIYGINRWYSAVHTNIFNRLAASTHTTHSTHSTHTTHSTHSTHIDKNINTNSFFNPDPRKQVDSQLPDCQDPIDCFSNASSPPSSVVSLSPLESAEVNLLQEQMGRLQELVTIQQKDLLPHISVDILDQQVPFCIDTGACVSVLGRSMLHHVDHSAVTPLTFRISSVNSTPITVYGKVDLPFIIGDKTFHHVFVLADVQKNLLGSDFFRQHNLWINVRQGILEENVAQNNAVVLAPSAPITASATLLEPHSPIVDAPVFHHSININSNPTQALDIIPPPTTTSNQFQSHNRGSTETLPNFVARPGKWLQNPEVVMCDAMAVTQTLSMEPCSTSAISSISDIESLPQHLVDMEPSPFDDDNESCASGFMPLVMDVNDYNINLTAVDSKFQKKGIPLRDNFPTSELCPCPTVRESTMSSLRSQFPEVFSGELRLIAKHDVTMRINLNDNFKCPYVYRVPVYHHQPAKERINEMLDKGIIRRSSSSFASPITCASKKDGTVRLCGDFRALNRITISDQFPLPRIDEIKQHIRGCIFTSLDLKDGFYQVPVHKDDIHKTAIKTPWGLYEYLKMPFGLKNAPSTFQRFVDVIFHDLKDFLQIYIDDVIIFSNSYQEHIDHVTQVFQRMNQFGLTIQEKKCTFFASTVQYLGYEFSTNGYRPINQVMPRIMDFPQPADKKGVQKFLGTVNYYRSHIPSLAQLATPLYRLLKNGIKFQWTQDCQESFQQLKTLLSERMILVPFTGKGQLELYTDASSVACGAALLQDKEPVEFFSKKFSPAEQRYSTYEREATALVAALVHFRPLLLGFKFTVFTDHKPLLSWYRTQPPTKRLERLFIKIQDFNFDLQYVEGSNNVLADLMSRPPDVHKASLDIHTLNKIEFDFLTEELREAQNAGFIRSCQLPPENLYNINGFMYTDRSGQMCLLVPPAFRHDLITAIHGLGHFGRRKTIAALQKQYFWKGMYKQVGDFIKHCTICQRYKQAPPRKRTPIQFRVSSRFEIVHIDLVGPLDTSQKGNKYLLTILDRFSLWLEAIPINSITAENVAKKFITHWVARFGLPQKILSDQGTQFESAVFDEVLRYFDIKRVRTTAYHPQTNGLLERMHGTLKTTLRCLMNESRNWEDKLPFALLALRTALNETGTSPAIMMYGEPLRVPGTLLNDHTRYPNDFSSFTKQLCDTLKQVQQYVKQPEQLDLTPINFDHQYVYLKAPFKRNMWASTWQGPYKVLDTQGPVIRIERNGVPHNVNIDRVKPATVLLSSNDLIDRLPNSNQQRNPNRQVPITIQSRPLHHQGDIDWYNRPHPAVQAGDFSSHNNCGDTAQPLMDSSQSSINNQRDHIVEDQPLDLTAASSSQVSDQPLDLSAQPTIRLNPQSAYQDMFQQVMSQQQPFVQLEDTAPHLQSQPLDLSCQPGRSQIPDPPLRRSARIAAQF